MLQVMIQNSKNVPFFFDQTILLIGQVFNSLTYHRRKDVLPTLIDNKARVKEIMKEQEHT